LCKEKIIFVNDFGILPNSGEDATESVKLAINAAAKEHGAVKLEFKKGRYDFYCENSIKAPYYISNTSSEIENPDVTKNIGICVKGINNMIIDGNDSLFIFHGKMTTIVIDKSEDIKIINLNIDFHRPTISEMTVEAIGDNYIDFKVNNDSWYEIKNNKIIWVGEGFKYSKGPSQEYDPEKDITWRTWNPGYEADKVIELEPYKLRCFYKEFQETKVGNVFQFRDGIRDQVGAFINKSKNIAFDNVRFHYMHGLGIACQYSENLFLNKIKLTPREETGRTAAAFADFLHISGCKGKVCVWDSEFYGAHDDAINVHGTHMKIIEKISDDEVVVRFMHPQSYGFDALHSGDLIDFIDTASLTVLESSSIKAVEQLTPRDILVKLNHRISENIIIGHCIENVTWTPTVEIKRNKFARIPTRGILITTRKKVLIEENIFYGMGMSGVLIADDAESWYESGIVTDVIINNNKFINCGSPVINILPENKDIRLENPVHKNISIKENYFEIMDEMILYAKSTQGLNFFNNKIITYKEQNGKLDSMVKFLQCSDVDLYNNVIEEK
jgi:hypothetical protein